MSIRNYMIWGFAGILTAAFGTGCGKKDSSSTDSGTTTTTSGGTTTTTTGGSSGTSLAVAYPSQLALAIFTDTSGASLRLGDAEDSAAGAEAAAKPIKERAEEEEKLARGEADSCFPAAMERRDPGEGGESCYEFDQDMLYGARGTSLGSYQGSMNGKNAAGEACLPAFAKSRSAGINDILEKSKGMIASMMCQAKKADPDVAPPAAVGDKLDLKEVLTTAFGAKADRIEEAFIERLDNADDGNEVYRSVVKMEAGGSVRTVVMVHSPAADGTYRGSMSSVVEKSATSLLLTGMDGGGDGMVPVLTIVYAKTLEADGSSRINAELRRASLAEELIATAIGSDGQLDFNAHRDFAVAENDNNYGKGKKAAGGYYNSNEDLRGQTRILFSMNPDTDEGTFAYWQNPGSNYGEAARGMVANIAMEAGVKKGCAVSGAALGATNLMQAYSIGKGLKDDVELAPQGFYHPFFSISTGPNACTMTSNPGSDADGTFYAASCSGSELMKWYQPKIADTTLAEEFASEQVGGIVTRQCYVFNADSGLYEVDTAEITEDAGYELVRNNDSAKLVAPPDFGESVKPFDGGVGKLD